MLYFIIFIISGIALTVDMILRYLADIKSFGMERFGEDYLLTHKLFFMSVFKDFEDLPLQDFLPHSLTMIIGYVCTFSAAGLSLRLLALPPAVHLPCAVMSAFLMCFAVQNALPALKDRFTGHVRPTGDDASGLRGYCTKTVEPDSYGGGRITSKERTYDVIISSAHADTSIEEFDKITVLYEHDGVYISVKDIDLFREIE